MSVENGHSSPREARTAATICSGVTYSSGGAGGSPASNERRCAATTDRREMVRISDRRNCCSDWPRSSACRLSCSISSGETSRMVSTVMHAWCIHDGNTATTQEMNPRAAAYRSVCCASCSALVSAMPG